MKNEIVCIDHMSVEELELHIIKLNNEEHKHEWQYDFTRLEVAEIQKLIREKRNAAA